jgi:ADP-ribose pyrophosphatase YjhB (NUDIX family)
MTRRFGDFDFCPRCGASRDHGEENRFRCSRCGTVLFFNPASAVAAFLAGERGRVLFVRRARDPGKGLLGLPGGFVDFGESAEEALRREVREEVGVELASIRYLGSCPNTYDYLSIRYRTTDLFFVSEGADLSCARPLDDVASLVWRDPKDVDPAELAFDSMRWALARFLTSSRRNG